MFMEICPFISNVTVTGTTDWIDSQCTLCILEPSLCVKQMKTVQRIHMNVKLTEVYISVFVSFPHSRGQAADLTHVVVVYKLVFILDKYH